MLNSLPFSRIEVQIINQVIISQYLFPRQTSIFIHFKRAFLHRPTDTKSHRRDSDERIQGLKHSVFIIVKLQVFVIVNITGLGIVILVKL